MMKKMIQNFLHKIQHSDETTKKFWLVALSGISMMIVVSGWLVYIDKTVATVSGENENLAIASAPLQNKKSGEPGVLSIFSAGIKTIFDVLKNKLAVKNKIIIESPERNFVSENVQPIPPTNLE